MILPSVMFSAALTLVRKTLSLISDACVYGDYRGLFDVGAGRKLSCSQIGSEAPYKCYEANTEADCCVTCSRLRRTDVSGKHDSNRVVAAAVTM